MPLDKVRKVLKISKEPVSLEKPVGDEEDSSLGDFIEDTKALALLSKQLNLIWASYNKDFININS